MKPQLLIQIIIIINFIIINFIIINFNLIIEHTLNISSIADNQDFVFISFDLSS